MSREVIDLGNGFWNLRGSFRIFKILNIGTHASLVRLKSGRFVFLDSYTLTTRQRRLVDKLTDGGEKVEAILNLHPFHTVHCERMHEDFPHAQLYGSRRHVDLFPNLPWESELMESAEARARFADDFEFSIPSGVDYISDNERIHFSSVLAYHKASGVIHSDDTLMYLKLPLLFRLFGKKPQLSFHPTLAQALEKRAGSADDFQSWAESLAEAWGDARAIATAHTSVLSSRELKGTSAGQEILRALADTQEKLNLHRENIPR